MRPLLAILFFLAHACSAADPVIEQQDLWTSGADGYHTYRIPALLATPRGTLLAFCEGRKTGSGDHGDVDLLMKRSTDAGKTWSAQSTVHEEGGEAKTTIGNPCVVADAKTGTVWLAFTRNNRAVLLTSSKDDGRTWSMPRDISDQVMRPDWFWVATGPGVGIQLARGERAGRLIIPCDHKLRGVERGSECRSHVMFSDDGGETWKLSDAIGNGGNECQVVELGDGSLLLNTRMQGDYRGFRGISRSRDAGATWTPIEQEENLPCPQCQGSLIAYPHPNPGAAHPFLFFANPPLNPEITGKRTKASRRDLTVRISADGGGHWSKQIKLHDGLSAYSCLAVPDARTVLCLYEAGKKNPMEVLRLARIPMADLTSH